VAAARYREIVQDLLAAIRSGTLVAGARLPGEREISAKYGVSAATARRAIRELQVMGAAEGRQGSGNYVRAEGVPSTDDVDHLVAARRALKTVDWRGMSAAETAQLHALLAIADSLDRLTAEERGFAERLRKSGD